MVEDFPPAPWRLGGRAWGAVVRVEEAPALPRDVTPLLPPGLGVLMLVRYLSGVLRYDELVVGAAVRRGARVGLYVQLIRVDDEVSVRGGREIWGLPKEPAEFAWEGPDQVRVIDGNGPLATLRVGAARRRTPRLPLPLGAFGTLGGRRAYGGGRLTGRVAPVGVEVCAWSRGTPVRLAERRAVAAVAADPFRMRMDAPRLVGDVIP